MTAVAESGDNNARRGAANVHPAPHVQLTTSLCRAMCEMMLLWIFSDIHLEILETRPSYRPSSPRDLVIRPDADIAVIAGDLHHVREAVGAAYALVGPDLPIVQVPGNHEHYGMDLKLGAGIARMRQDAARARAAGNEIHVLENEAIVIERRGERVRFIGATPWTDFALFGDAASSAEDAQRGMNDFVRIRSNRPGYDVIRAPDIAGIHAKSRAFIEAELRKPFDGPTVVVTHHAPSIRSIHPKYRNDPLTVAFASNCDDLLGLGADLWVHGHVHHSVDYRVDRTRVICNPRGYEFRGRIENASFDPGLVISVGRDGA